MKMPVLFVGHGSPMNIIADNSYTRSLQQLGPALPRPRAILVISAHWQTRGPFVTSAPQPPLIYDFYGFPAELYRQEYGSPGSPEVASRLQAVTGQRVMPAAGRGIDHAAWAVLKHLYPAADIPVLEMSLDRLLSPQAHFDLAKSLAPLREEGVLLLGSGNLVHNLAKIDFSALDAPAFEWAVRFDREMERLLLNRETDRLIAYDALPDVQWAVPTDEHYLPMLYAAALREENESLRFCCTDIQNGSIAMRSFVIGG